jgi:D-arabinose 1-dehydrogenase-like Zn-dependent alcohol dehydrogenase
MYSSIMKTKTRPGNYLAILGAGGGLGHMYDSRSFPDTEYLGY